MKLLIKNIKNLVLAGENLQDRVAGKDMQDLAMLPDSWVRIIGNRIDDYGRMRDLNESEEEGEIYDATGRFVFPSYIDSHTHLVFAESREHEFEMRIHGASYTEIAEAGGGILNSARKLSDMPEELLFESAKLRLQEIIKLGTGAVEIKSGYGLSTEAELKMLRVIRSLKKISPIPIKATFLGAHAFPLEYKNNPDAYVKLIIEDMLPKVANENLADYVDVFCDTGFFSVADTEKILEAAGKYGLKTRIHANELERSGGIQTGVKFNSLSVDHLEHTGAEEIEALLNSETIPTLLPSTAFFLNLIYPPARTMIDAGLPVCLATDYNPGSSPSGNMNFVIALACIKLKMTPEEAFNAAIRNAAFSLELSNNMGSVSRGKLANLFITEPMSSIAYIPYSFAHSRIEQVVLNGVLLKK